MLVKPVVANNTPLVAFWTIARFDILVTLYGEILIPPGVQDEFLAVEQNSRLSALVSAPGLQVVSLANPARALAFAGLDRGEAEVLALAEERHARLVLIDEHKARRYAMRMGFPLSGTLGTLLLAKEAGIISSVSPLLSALQDAGLYLRPDLVVTTKQMAGESS
jgi:predicted nucleic acid-binding protein